MSPLKKAFSPDDTFLIADFEHPNRSLGERLLNGFEMTPEGKRAVEVCKLVAETQKFRILCLLHEHQTLNVTELVGFLVQTQPAVSHHLALLKNGGLIEPDRNGKNQYYSYMESARTALDLTGDYLLGLKSRKILDGTQESIPVTEELHGVDSFHASGMLTPKGETIMNHLKNIGDEVRLNILIRLNEVEHTVTEMCEMLGMEQPGVSHHLAIMKGKNPKSVNSQIIDSEQRGKHQFYSIPPLFLQNIHTAGRALKAFAAKKDGTYT